MSKQLKSKRLSDTELAEAKPTGQRATQVAPKIGHSVETSCGDLDKQSARDSFTSERVEEIMKQKSEVAKLPLVSTLGNNVTIRPPKLNGNNFRIWKTMIPGVLKLRGLEAKALGTESDEMKDIMAKLLIMEALDETHQAQVEALPTASAILNRLSKSYADATAANVERLLAHYYEYKPDPDKSMRHTIATLEIMKLELDNFGQRQTDKVFMIRIMNLLSEDYDNLKESWEGTHPDLKTVKNLISRIYKREDDLAAKTSQLEQAFMTNKLSTWRTNLLRMSTSESENPST